MTARVALAHDWLTGMRGGERVLERIAAAYPEAPIYTLLYEQGSVSAQIERHPIRTSFLQHFPYRSLYRWYLPLYPLAIRNLDLQRYDLVVSTSHCAAKAVVTRDDAIHLCYCHTPMRYAWDQFEDYFSVERVGRLKHAIIRPIMAWMREWDQRTASRVNAFAANSGFVRERIRRYYEREAEVIPPPVDTDRFVPAGQPEDFYLMVTALSPYKRVDVAIEAFNRMRRPLHIVGWGPERARLEAMAGPTIKVLGRLSDAQVVRQYQTCRGFVLPGVEDAGIAPLEAMACGRPAIVLADGGAPETVIPGVTGLHVEAPGVDALIEAIDSADHLTFNSDRIRAHAEAYSIASFDRRMSAFIARNVGTGIATS